MWKVRRLEEGELVVLMLSGRFDHGELAELQKVVASEVAHRNLVLDLEDVRLVDQAAVNFLADFEESGARLFNCPPYIRAWMGTEMGEMGIEEIGLEGEKGRE